ncbi:MAG TPA: penicillin-binding transpeptidase domain-containing protein [Candidatus Paceibacterota bacterium]|nr:penicillin-binding transpeptidase domain-containing protein [Candidatus Paceibacterota bacterium]
MNQHLDPDAIFLDAHNLAGLDTHQFEGRMERSLSRPTIIGVATILFLMIGAFLYRSASLQIVQGSDLFERSEKNRLERSIVFAERGVIFDRNGVPLAWNERVDGDFSRRMYSTVPGISHLTGYVKYPGKDSSGNYYSHDFDAREGAELLFDEELKGENGVKLRETDVSGGLLGESTVDEPDHGDSVYLSVDSRLQKILTDTLQKAVEERDFHGGAGMLMDIETGEVITHVSYPEFSSDVMTNGTSASIAAQLSDPRNVFLDRASVGLFAPGSIIKPFIALGALNENLISPEKSILSTGAISIPNPYFPDKPSVFRDWKAHGYVDMRRAIAVSSDVYFYAIGGGYEDQKGLGIVRIDEYMQQFGFGKPLVSPFFSSQSGVIPTPEWKLKTFDGDPWRLGDTYHTAIGQFGTLITPAQAVRAISGIATGDRLVEPTIIKGDIDTYAKSMMITFSPEDLNVVREGMHLAVEEGTMIALNGLPFEAAGKSGTAEVGANKEYVNSWAIGYYPYEKPKYAFVLLMEKGPRENTLGAPWLVRQFIDAAMIQAPEYFQFD